MLLLCLLFAADLTPKEANAKVGSEASVKFTVGSVGENAAGFWEAYSEKAWNVPGTFFLRVPKKTSKVVFKKLDVDGLDELVGCEVRVTGKVERLDFGDAGKYVTIVASGPKQVEVLSRPKEASRDYTPTKDYAVRKVSGFEVLISPAAMKDKKEFDAAMKELRRQLDDMPKYMDADKLARLRKVRIWMEHRQKNSKSAAQFHVSKGWLRGNGYNPDKVNCVEISNTRFFVEWAGTQPFMVLHELAHAHHNLVLGADHAGIKSVYKQAMDRKLYDKVKHADGREQRAYAATNDQEYFAELTEAYFGKNDFFPFTRDELRKHDPVGYALMEKVWGKPLR
jgi:hypothetical protein